MLPALIPLLALLAAALLIFLRNTALLTRRESLLIAATLATAWLVLGTESLSLLHAIRFLPLLLWWLIPPLLLTPFLLRELRRLPIKKILPSRPQLKWIDYALLAAITLILAWSFVQASFSPPNNVDSQEYHLQRQVFWMQQHSVQHYPASNLRQLAMPPLTEFAGLTLMVLTGNDHYHNLVQWFAFLLTLCAASLITRRFNPSPTAQLLAALWVATIPLAFMQASTTKNDVAVMMWISLLLYWTLLLANPSRLRWPHIALLGVAFGAAALTKGTGILFAAPLAIAAALFLFRYHTRAALPALALIAALALSLNAGHFLRNYQTFHSIAPDSPGIHDGPPLSSEDHSPGALLSTMFRTAGSHLVSPYQPLNDKFTQWMHTLHDALGRNIDDPHTTWLPGGRFRPYEFHQDDEDKAAAPAHMLLLPIPLLLARRQIPWKPTLLILFTFIAAFLLFSLLLKWQAWHVRLIITLPALLAPVFAWTFAARKMRFILPLAALLLLITLIPSFNSIPRPLLGAKTIFNTDPLALRCYYHPNWADDYRQLAAHLDNLHPRTVAFSTGAGSPDYPMQRLLLDRYSPPPLFTPFNATLQLPNHPEPDPDALLVARTNPARLQHTSTGTWYIRESHIGRYTLLLPAPTSNNAH